MYEHVQMFWVSTSARGHPD